MQTRLSAALAVVVVILLFAVWNLWSRVSALEELSGTTGEATSLRAEVQELRAELAAVQARRGDRPSRRGSGRDRAGREERADRGDPGRRERIERAAVAGMAAEQGVEPSTVVEALESDPEAREVLDRLVREGIEAERDQRWEQRRERWAEQAAEQLDQFASAHGVSPQVRTTLDGLLSDEREAVGELFREARREGNFGEARDAAQELRGETDAEAKRVLTEEQYTAWVGMREEEQARRFGRGR